MPPDPPTILVPSTLAPTKKNFAKFPPLGSTNVIILLPEKQAETRRFEPTSRY